MFTSRWVNSTDPSKPHFWHYSELEMKCLEAYSPSTSSITIAMGVYAYMRDVCYHGRYILVLSVPLIWPSSMGNAQSLLYMWNKTFSVETLNTCVWKEETIWVLVNTSKQVYKMHHITIFVAVWKLTFDDLRMTWPMFFASYVLDIHSLFKVMDSVSKNDLKTCVTQLCAFISQTWPLVTWTWPDI